MAEKVDDILQEVTSSDYKYGFTSNFETDEAPVGLDESIIRFISDKKQWILSKIHFFKGVDSKAIRTFSHKDYLENKDKARAK